MRLLIAINKIYIALQLKRACHSSEHCKLIDGKRLADKYLNQLKTKITEWVNNSNRAPHLSVIMIESNSTNETYVNMKLKAAKRIGITTDICKISKATSQEDLLKIIENINLCTKTDGILVQLPLSPHMNLREVCHKICPKKDVDGFTPESLGKLCLNEPSFVPCTALAVHRIISSLGINLTGRKAVICGRSKHVGLPIALVLHSSVKLGNVEGLNMSTTICHRHTPEDQVISFTKRADVLVTAVGIPNLIKGNMVKPGAIVIDVGFTETKEGTKRFVVGDVNTSEVQKVAGILSPVPGGVGPMTVAMLMSNTFLAAKRNNSKSKIKQ